MSARRRAGPPSVERRLFEDGPLFDFFQAVRLLHRLAADRPPVGGDGPPWAEPVRFRAHLSLSFPPSAIYDIRRPDPDRPVPEMTQAFLGLVGPSGVLPRHYTELVCRLARETAEPEAGALREWLDLFQNRFTALFYKAWEKYRFPLAFERGEPERPQPDLFTRALYSLIGLGFRPLRNRLTIARRGAPGPPLARIPDLSLLYYSGLLAHHPKNALGLEAILRDYFELPARVRQFQGEWLLLDEPNRTRIGEDESHNQLGLGAIVGDRVWEVRHKIRVRLGPLRYRQFEEFLPDQEPVPRRKAVFLLAHLVRLYAGPDLDFDVQLVLIASEVPETRLVAADGRGSQLGWNSWLITTTPAADAEDAVFEGAEVFEVG